MIFFKNHNFGENHEFEKKFTNLEKFHEFETCSRVLKAHRIQNIFEELEKKMFNKFEFFFTKLDF